MKISLVTITWNNSDVFDIEKTTIFNSFKKFNPNTEFNHFHFNRNNYQKEEIEYNERFGDESDYILYKISMLKNKLKQIYSYYVIFCDASDVFCLGSIDHLVEVFDLEKNIIIGSEKNQWPTPERKMNWIKDGFKDYSGFDANNEFYLNSGVILSKRENFIKMLELMEEKILSKNIKDFKNDQAVYTWYYTSGFEPVIKLDYNNTFAVNTFKRSKEDFYLDKENKLVSKKNGVKPCFVHDNGWNHGSPKFINQFNLKRLYSEECET